MRLLLFALISIFATQMSATDNDFIRGCYYDLKGQKIDGYIYYYDYKTIKFKSDLNSTPIKLRPTEVKKFYLGRTEFRVLENFKIKPDFIFFKEGIKKGFVQVLIEGRANLYLCRVCSANGSMFVLNDYYLIEHDNNKQYIQPHKNRYRFRKQISNIFKSNELNDIVLKNNWGYYQTEQLIEEFNRTK